MKKQGTRSKGCRWSPRRRKENLFLRYSRRSELNENRHHEYRKINSHSNRTRDILRRLLKTRRNFAEFGEKLFSASF